MIDRLCWYGTACLPFALQDAAGSPRTAAHSLTHAPPRRRRCCTSAGHVNLALRENMAEAILQALERDGTSTLYTRMVYKDVVITADPAVVQTVLAR